jgi:PhzF family phenazine biosynthesis protein
MSTIPFWQIDAFSDRPFGGNPAAVCWLEQPADELWMQQVAAEMNLAETAFVRRLSEGFELRWFTPTIEVDLCGHATLASAHALWTSGLVPAGKPIPFHTRSGVLTCTQTDNWIELDFPATPAKSIHLPMGLAEALGAAPREVLQSKFDFVAVFDAPSVLRRLRPDFRALATFAVRGVIATTHSDDGRFDFLARFFGPASGIDEDPATGSAYCSLAPYWSPLLAKQQLTAYQASARGGIIRCRVNEDRVILAGNATTVCRGELLV